MKYIAFAGNIGAGKTTLARALVSYLDAQLLEEEFENNKLLHQFYKENPGSVYELECSMLESRLKQLNETGSEKVIVSDFWLAKSLVFAKINLNKSDYNRFLEVYAELTKDCMQPDVIIYLQNSIEKLQTNIRKRARDYEQKIENSYLEGLTKGYEYSLESTDVTVIWSAELEKGNSDIETVVSAVAKKIDFLTKES